MLLDHHLLGDTRAVRRPSCTPAAPGQLRFWRLRQAEPDNPAYQWPWASRLRGPLDEQALREALHAMLDRHEVLTAAFHWSDGQLWQLAQPTVEPPLRTIDLSELALEDHEPAIQQAIKEDNLRPFDLRAGPPIRLDLLRLADNNHVLVVDVHNIASDVWSMRIFLDELAKHYTATVTGTPAGLASPASQYSDHAADQRRWLAGDKAERQVDYWTRQLAGLTPTRLTTGPAGSYRSSVVRAELPPGLPDALRGLGRTVGASPFMTMFAIFAALLGRRTGRDDIAVGSSVGGRNRPQLERTIGYFVNRVVLRMDVGGAPSAGALIEQARDVALHAFAHAEVPFEYLLERVRPDEYSNRAPLVPVMFVFDAPNPGTPIDFAGLTLEPIESEFRTTRFDLLVNASLTAGGGVALEAHHPCDRLDQETVTSMLNAYIELLTAAAEQKGLPT